MSKARVAVLQVISGQLSITTADKFVSSTALCDRFGLARNAIPRYVAEGMPGFRLDNTRRVFPATSARPGWPSTPWTPRQTWRNIAPSTPRAWRVRAGRPLLSRRYITIIVVDNAEPYACPRKVR